MKNTSIVFTAIIIGIYISLLNMAPVYALTGKLLFSKEGCIMCHSINGNGGSLGPNLSTIGKKRSLTFIKRMIKNPSLNFFTPNSWAIINGKIYRSIMPAGKGRISKNDINALSEYLKSLK